MQGLPEEEVQLQQLEVETKFSRKSMRTLDSLVSEIAMAVHDCFRRRRRLGGDDLGSLFDRMDDLIRNGMVMVASHRDERAATRYKPKGEAYESMYVVVTNQETDTPMRNMAFRMHAIRVFGTRKKVVLEARPMPFVFSRHAAARFYERGLRPDEAVATLGSFLHEWSVAPSLVEDALDSVDALRLSLPGPSGGLLMGYFDASAAVPETVMVTFDQYGGRRDTVPASPLAPGLFIVSTFVSEAGLRPVQSDYRKCLCMWRQACGRTYEAVLKDMTWPVREVLPSEGAEIDPVTVRALETLVSHPQALNAMGNGPGPSRLPEAHYSSPKSNSSQNLTHSA